MESEEEREWNGNPLPPLVSHREFEKDGCGIRKLLPVTKEKSIFVKKKKCVTPAISGGGRGFLGGKHWAGGPFWILKKYFSGSPETPKPRFFW